MLNQAFFKRIIPFILTFALGLFIASFFVSIAPNFQFKRNSRSNMKKEMQKLRYENERLRFEVERLKIQNLEETDKMLLLEAPVPPQLPMRTMPMDSVPTAPRAK